MDYFWFLFRFEGRINRAKYWLAMLIFACSMFLLLMVLALIARTLGVTLDRISIGTSTVRGSLHFAASLLRGDEPRSAATLFHLLYYVIAVPMTAVCTWCYAATSIKRLHDRNKSGWWAVAFLIAPPLLNTTLWDWLDDPTLALLVSALAFVLSIWGFLELFCLPGTRGPNRFGPDPLAPATAPVTAMDTSPGWDQHGELEFVLHGAGPSAGPHVNRGP